MPASPQVLRVTEPARPCRWRRMMQTELEAQADASCVLDMAALLDMRVSRAAALRHALGLPSEDTDVYRLINSEGDRCLGLAVAASAAQGVLAQGVLAERAQPQAVLALSALAQGVQMSGGVPQGVRALSALAQDVLGCRGVGQSALALPALASAVLAGGV